MGKDTVANLITSIRNAYIHQKEIVRVISTNMTENIVKSLFFEGFIKNVRKYRQNNKYFLVSTLRRHNKRKGMQKTVLTRISRPGRRIYSSYQAIPKILGGMGITILSTSQGIMTDREARLKGIGGEMLCHIYTY